MARDAGAMPNTKMVVTAEPASSSQSFGLLYMAAYLKGSLDRSKHAFNHCGSLHYLVFLLFTVAPRLEPGHCG